MKNNRSANPLTLALILAFIVVAIFVGFKTCDNKNTATAETTTTTSTSTTTSTLTYGTVSDSKADEVISSIIDKNNFSTEQLSYMNIVYNPYTMEVGNGLIVFPKDIITNNFYTLYLFGIDNPKAIEVEGWYMVEKTKLDNGLVKLTVTDQGANGVTIPEGTILLDGREIIHMR